MSTVATNYELESGVRWIWEDACSGVIGEGSKAAKLKIVLRATLKD